MKLAEGGGVAVGPPTLIYEIFLIVCRSQKKADYIKRTSAILVEKYNGDIPDTFQGLVSTWPSLVPRPHPLMRRTGLVNQVKFLGLAHAFTTV